MRSFFVAALAAFATTAALSAQNDECTGAVLVTDGANGPFTNVGSTTSLPAWPCGLGGNDIWFVYRASCTGTLTGDTCGSGFDTVLQVFDATCTACGSFTAGVCNDDACGLQSSVSLAVTTGGTYYFRVGGFGGSTGTFGLNITCTAGGGGPADDECLGATPISLGVNAGLTNIGYTTSSPGWPCGAGGNDVWFSFRAACTAPHTFYTCGLGTNFDTTLQVFSGLCGCSGAGLTDLGCNDDSCGLQSSVTASLTLGTVYLVRVGGFAGRTGNFDLTVDVGTGTGTITAMGVGACGGITIATTGNPNINGNLTTTLGGIGAGLPVIAYGFLAQNLNFCATCALGHDWSIVIPGASFAVTIPCDPTLIGANLYTQGAEILGSGCPAFSLSMTDTEQIDIG